MMKKSMIGLVGMLWAGVMFAPDSFRINNQTDGDLVADVRFGGSTAWACTDTKMVIKKGEKLAENIGLCAVAMPLRVTATSGTAKGASIDWYALDRKTGKERRQTKSTPFVTFTVKNKGKKLMTETPYGFIGAHQGVTIRP